MTNFAVFFIVASSNIRLHDTDTCNMHEGPYSYSQQSVWMMRKHASLPSKIIRQIVKPVELKGPARLYVIEIICTPQQLHEERTFGGSLRSGHLFSASRLQLFVLSKFDPLQSTNNTATTWWPLCTSWKLLRLLFWFVTVRCTRPLIHLISCGIAFVYGD